VNEKPRVLIVDDELDNVDALTRLLRRDFEVLAALSGEDALKMLGTNGQVDVVVSDQRMPGMSGSEFLEKVRHLDPVPTRILLTGFADLEAVIEAVNRGQIWRYIAKPWEPDDFTMAVKQAAERTRLSRSLNQSRRELERALNELRAKDWARERLLQILLHEFRTAPQILEGLEQLDPGGGDAAARKTFIRNLRKRFAAMQSDIEALLQEEKKFGDLPKEALKVSPILAAIAGNSFRNNVGSEELAVLSNGASLAIAFKHLHELVSRNSEKAPVSVSIDQSTGPAPNLYVTFAIEGKALLPEGLQKLDANLAWTALLEPFVGMDDFAHHSTGLRVQTASMVRMLSAIGGRAEIQVIGGGKRVELHVSFKTI
jgi:CheY-like chemotaxis protein